MLQSIFFLVHHRSNLSIYLFNGVMTRRRKTNRKMKKDITVLISVGSKHEVLIYVLLICYMCAHLLLCSYFSMFPLSWPQKQQNNYEAQNSFLYQLFDIYSLEIFWQMFCLSVSMITSFDVKRGISTSLSQKKRPIFTFEHLRRKVLLKTERFIST